MRAATVRRFGVSDVLEVSEMPDPIPGPGTLSIDVAHAAVGLIDVFIRQGLYKDRAGLPQPPYVPGLEVAGSIRQLGDRVDGFIAGEPVVTVTGTGAEGGYAAISVVDARFVVSLGSSGVWTAPGLVDMTSTKTGAFHVSRLRDDAHRSMPLRPARLLSGALLCRASSPTCETLPTWLPRGGRPASKVTVRAVSRCRCLTG